MFVLPIFDGNRAHSPRTCAAGTECSKAALASYSPER
jgi:hypothetical protein